MTTTWFNAQVLWALARDGARPLAGLLDSLERDPIQPPHGIVERTIDGWRFQVAGIVGNTVGVFEAQPTADASKASHAPPKWRSVIIPSDVLDALLDEVWDAAYDRLVDIANIDEARRRTGLKYVQDGCVSAIFIAGEYHRLHFVIDSKFVTALGAFDAKLFAGHKYSSAVQQPPDSDRKLWQRLHTVATETREGSPRLRTRPLTPVPPPRASLPPPEDGWMTVSRLRELGVSDDSAIRAVLALNCEADLTDIIGMVADDAYERIEDAFKNHFARQRAQEARQRAAQFTSLEIVRLSTGTRRLEGEMSFDEALARLTAEQRRVVCREPDAPMRVKGGPGTGKTLAALLRAGFLALRAKAKAEPVRIGFFVFNADLGRDIATRMDSYGLGEFLEPSSPQSIVVTSLHDWCTRFVNLDSLHVEALPPYRADRTQVDRRAALELAVEEARRRLDAPEYTELWKLFDAKSKSGLREIETEISQFIKARDIVDLKTYLDERRPPNWWLAQTGKAFKTFVWEVATVYNDVLRQLGFMDADDLTNDAVKEVSKSVWQTYQRPKDGFDYLVLDEAQDFFRNQLTLVRQLVKRPDGFLMCFDESQAVYSRYPSLRDIGFDTGSTKVQFQISRLERNFRSTREIVAALRMLATKYPMVGAQDDWGELQADVQTPAGPLPSASGFGTEDGMFGQARDIVRRTIEAGTKPSSIAIVGFDDALLARLTARLRADRVSIHELDGTGRQARRAVTVANARHVKGQQFDACVLVGVDRDSMPDFRDVRSTLHGETRREDDLRLFVVAMSRARRDLHFLWAGTDPSEFVTALGHTVRRTE